MVVVGLPSLRELRDPHLVPRDPREFPLIPGALAELESKPRRLPGEARAVRMSSDRGHEGRAQAALEGLARRSTWRRCDRRRLRWVSEVPAPCASHNDRAPCGILGNGVPGITLDDRERRRSSEVRSELLEEPLQIRLEVRWAEANEDTPDVVLHQQRPAADLHLEERRLAFSLARSEVPAVCAGARANVLDDREALLAELPMRQLEGLFNPEVVRRAR